MKKITGKQATEHYKNTNEKTGEITDKKPEFNNMSRRPGIGKRWLEKYTSDVYPDGKTVINGLKVNAPRYYDNQWKKNNEQQFEEHTQYKRQQEAIQRRTENPDERRKAREQIQRAQLTRLKRTL